MTEKQLLKYEGKNVCITMHLFPHSVSKKSLRGTLQSDPALSATIRNGVTHIKEHFDFYLMPLPNETRKAELIPWYQVKLIIEVNEL